MERFGPILRIDRTVKGHFRRPLKTALVQSGELLEKLKMIRHPNLMAVYDYDDHYVYVEYIDGLILSNRSPHCPKHHSECWIDTYGSIDLAPIADGVRTLHDHGICHGDITSHNIMVRRDGTPKLIDLTCALPKRAEFVRRDLEMLAAIERELRLESRANVPPARAAGEEVEIGEWMDRIETELRSL